MVMRMVSDDWCISIRVLSEGRSRLRGSKCVVKIFCSVMFERRLAAV